MSARDARGLTGPEYPSTGSPRQKLEFALRLAALAPVANKGEGWDFRVADTHLELVVGSDRLSEATDPDRRESIIGCGAALTYLKLALRHFGCLGRVALFPDLGEPELVARVHYGSCQERDARERILFDAISGDPANDSRLGGTPVSEAMLAALSQAVAGERSWLDFAQSESSRQFVLRITPAADERGTTLGRLLPRAAQSNAGGVAPRSPGSSFPLGDPDADPWKMPVEPIRDRSLHASTLAVVKTKTDDCHGWLAAGEAMARTILVAQTLGLAWAFHDPMRRREARAALRRGVGHKGFAQVILRLHPFATVHHGCPPPPFALEESNGRRTATF